MRWTAIFAFVLLCRPSLAQPADGTATVSGNVLDAESGGALVGANIFAIEARRGTATDDDGAFALTLPVGEYDVVFSYLGFRPDTLHLGLRDDINVQVRLAPTATPMDEVNVVGRRDETDPHSTISTVELPISELERLPAFLGEVDVIKAIQLLPGVQSGAEGTTGLYVRGGGPDQNLILLDGTPVYNPGHVFGFLSVFNSNTLERVRLVKGGFPARYGGRLSSVVDLTMKKGSRDAFSADGTVGLVFSSLTAEGPLVSDRASFIASARRTYIDVLARPFINKRLQEGQSLASYFYDANAKIDYRISPRSSLELSAYYGQDVYEATDETRDGDFRERYTAGADWGNLVSSLAWNYQISSRLSSRMSVSLSRYHFDVFTVLSHFEDGEASTRSSEEITYRSGITDWMGSTDLSYTPFRNHRLRFGAGAVRHAFNPGVTGLKIDAWDEDGIDSTLTPNAFRSASWEGHVYAEDEADLGTRWKANLGIMLAMLAADNATYASAQPRLSIRYLIDRNWSLRSSFSSMHQSVHLLTNSGLHLPTDLWVSSTTKIAPQKSWQASLASVYSDSENRYRASIESFYKRMDGLIEYEPGASYLAPNQDWQEKVVVGSGRSYGVELYLRRRVGRLTGWIGYTLSWSKRTFDELNEGETFPYRYDRRHDVSVVVNYELSRRVDIGGTWVYGTGQAITLASARFADGRLLDPRSFSGWMPQLREYGERGGYRMAPYHRLDLAVNIDFGSVLFVKRGESSLSVGAYNVYNRRNPFYLFEGRRKDGSRVYKQASLFPVIPFVSYRFHL